MQVRGRQNLGVWILKGFLKDYLSMPKPKFVSGINLHTCPPNLISRK